MFHFCVCIVAFLFQFLPYYVSFVVKYPEIEDIVLKEDEAVYLTKNGYGTMVVMSLEKYSKIVKQLSIENEKEREFGETDIEKMLDEFEEELENPKTRCYTHDEVFSKARRIANGEEKLSN